MWGTVEYFAPEVYSRAYGFQADIWSLGCILYEMLTGEIAFPTRELQPTLTEKLFVKMKGMTTSYSHAQRREFEKRTNYKELSGDVRDLLKGMLKPNPLKRFDIDECLAHPWITLAETIDDSDFYYNHELIGAKKIVRERSLRRVKRYEALVKEIERDDRRKHALSVLNLY